jgi:hypothetical protein
MTTYKSRNSVKSSAAAYGKLLGSIVPYALLGLSLAGLLSTGLQMIERGAIAQQVEQQNERQQTILLQEILEGLGTD